MDKKKGGVSALKSVINYIYGNVRDNIITTTIIQTGTLKLVGGKIGLGLLLLIL